jgi:hypothetical protein
MTLARLVCCSGLAALVASCGGAEAKPAIAGVVDSAVSRDSAIVRFQRSLPRVTSFEGGARGRDQLVHEFVVALKKRDTAGLHSLVLDRSEFGWLYYPTNPEGKPPYSLTPQLMWFMLEGHNDQGYRKLLQKRAGKPLHVLGYRCDGELSDQGENTVWGPCVVLRKTEIGDTIAERLFGQIVERGGRYKFLSYANKL